MFEEPGTFFKIELINCSTFRYEEYDAVACEDLVTIQSQEPEILSVASEQPLVLDCVMGMLELDYDEMRVTLPSGKEVQYEELCSASKRYWDEWKADSKK